MNFYNDVIGSNNNILLCKGMNNEDAIAQPILTILVIKNNIATTIMIPSSLLTSETTSQMVTYARVKERILSKNNDDGGVTENKKMVKFKKIFIFKYR